jgi:hypothetical protein
VTLDEEAKHATELLAGKVVQTVSRHRPEEVLIQFTDGTRLFVDINGTSLELSIADSRSG